MSTEVHVEPERVVVTIGTLPDDRMLPLLGQHIRSAAEDGQVVIDLSEVVLRPADIRAVAALLDEVEGLRRLGVLLTAGRSPTAEAVPRSTVQRRPVTRRRPPHGAVVVGAATVRRSPMQPLAELTDGLASDRRIDAAERVVARCADALGRDEAVRSVLAGRWLGHPLHPVLTDLPIGFWTSAFVLDLGGRRYREASDALIAAGVASALPAIAAGLVDWRPLDRPASRLGVLHAVSNGTATALYAASLLARRRDRRAAGLALSTVAGAVASLGGYLGGRLAFETDPGPVDVGGADASAGDAGAAAGAVDEVGTDDRVDPGR